MGLTRPHLRNLGLAGASDSSYLGLKRDVIPKELGSSSDVRPKSLGSGISARPKDLGSAMTVRPKELKTFFILLIFFNILKKLY